LREHDDVQGGPKNDTKLMTP